jgi:hypothetical protein
VVLGDTCSQWYTWASGAASYVKQIDPKHLVTIGWDPGTISGGQGDCAKLYEVPGVDFNSLHYYSAYTFSSVAAAVAHLRGLGKPVVVEEFDVGSPPPPRPLPAWYIQEFQASMDSAFCAGASGFMFWGWSVPQTYNWPIFWAHEDHNANDTTFVNLIQSYRYPFSLNVTSKYGTVTGGGCYAQGSVRTVSVASSIVNASEVSGGIRERLSGWLGTGNGSYTGPSQVATVTMNGPINETATWVTQYKVTIQATQGGNVTTSQTGEWFDAGTRLTLTALPARSYQFGSWYVNDILISNSSVYNLVVNRPMKVAAVFNPLEHSTSVTSTTSMTSSSSTPPTATSTITSTSNTAITTAATGGGGIPEFPYQLIATAVLTLLLVASFLLVRRYRPLQRA